MRFIGLDVHRDFCEVAIHENGEVRSAGRVETSPEQLELFAESLGPDDRVALETTGNALRIARILERHVGGVLVADTRNVRAMTHAKVKNDRVDARMLAKLLAAGMLPGTWLCDEGRASAARPRMGRHGPEARRLKLRRSKCGWRDSNPHDQWPPAPKAGASTSSATSARGMTIEAKPPRRSGVLERGRGRWTNVRHVFCPRAADTANRSWPTPYTSMPSPRTATSPTTLHLDAATATGADAHAASTTTSPGPQGARR
jgi:hypothetical protein